MFKEKNVVIKAVATVLLAAPLLVFTAGCSSKPANDSTTQDETAVEQTTTENTTTDQGSNGKPETTGTDTGAAAAVEGENVYTGTCKIVTGKELFEMQDSIDDFAVFEADADSRFAIIVFDTPTPVYARFAGDPEAMNDAETDMICVAIDSQYPEGNIAAWEQYNGKKVTIQIDPMTTMWPSDVRLPIGKPHTGNAIVLAEHSD